MKRKASVEKIAKTLKPEQALENIPDYSANNDQTKKGITAIKESPWHMVTPRREIPLLRGLTQSISEFIDLASDNYEREGTTNIDSSEQSDKIGEILSPYIILSQKTERNRKFVEQISPSSTPVASVAAAAAEVKYHEVSKFQTCDPFLPSSEFRAQFLSAVRSTKSPGYRNFVLCDEEQYEKENAEALCRKKLSSSELIMEDLRLDVAVRLAIAQSYSRSMGRSSELGAYAKNASEDEKSLSANDKTVGGCCLEDPLVDENFMVESQLWDSDKIENELEFEEIAAPINGFLQMNRKVFSPTINEEKDPVSRCEKLLTGSLRRRIVREAQMESSEVDRNAFENVQSNQPSLGMLSTEMSTIETIFPCKAPSELSYINALSNLPVLCFSGLLSFMNTDVLPHIKQDSKDLTRDIVHINGNRISGVKGYKHIYKTLAKELLWTTDLQALYLEEALLTADVSMKDCASLNTPSMTTFNPLENNSDLGGLQTELTAKSLFSQDVLDKFSRAEIRALVILHLVNRTLSGGLCYEKVISVFENEDISLIVPNSKSAQPLDVIVPRCSSGIPTTILRSRTNFKLLPAGAVSDDPYANIDAQFMSDFNPLSIDETLVSLICKHLILEYEGETILLSEIFSERLLEFLYRTSDESSQVVSSRIAFLSGDDLLKFRTRHCERFVKLGSCSFSDKCQYSHDIEWTRRPLWKHNYGPQLCQFIRSVPARGSVEKLQHSCSLHRTCPSSHSREEQVFHPRVYKKVLCEQYLKGYCERYYCPFAHGQQELQGPVDGMVAGIFSATPQDALYPPSCNEAEDITTTARLTWHRDEHSSSGMGSKDIDNLMQLATNSEQSSLYSEMYSKTKTAPRNGIPTEMIRIRARTQKQLTRVWIGLSRLKSIKGNDPLAFVNPEFLYHDTFEQGIKEDSEDVGGVICVSVQSGLRPLAQAVDLFLLQQRVDQSQIPPPGLIDAIVAFLRGIEALHKADICHGHIVPNAILINSNWNVVLGGFLPGLLGTTTDTFEQMLWQSPEVVLAILVCDDVEKHRTMAADVFSAGLCLFYLISNRAHVFGNDTHEILANILSNNPANLEQLKSPLLYDLIAHMIHPMPSQRCSASEALQHPLFWSLHDTKDFSKKFCLTYFREDLNQDEALNLSIGWLDAIMKSKSNDTFVVERALVMLNGMDGAKKDEIPDGISKAKLLQTIQEQSTAGLLAFTYLISISECVDDIQNELTSVLFSQYSYQILKAYKYFSSKQASLKKNCHRNYLKSYQRQICAAQGNNTIDTGSTNKGKLPLTLQDRTKDLLPPFPQTFKVAQAFLSSHVATEQRSSLSSSQSTGISSQVSNTSLSDDTSLSPHERDVFDCVLSSRSSIDSCSTWRSFSNNNSFEEAQSWERASLLSSSFASPEDSSYLLSSSTGSTNHWMNSTSNFSSPTINNVLSVIVS